MPDNDHLTDEQVLKILDIVHETEAILIGGQCLNRWALHYLPKDGRLKAFEPFTSKDIDFFINDRAPERLAAALNGDVLVPDIDDATPNAAVVVTTLESRRIRIDFMSGVLGVEDRSIKNNFVTIEGYSPELKRQIQILLLDPLDCLRSRLSNINTLHREDTFSVGQARAAMVVVECFVNELLDLSARKRAQSILHDLYYVARDECLRLPAFVNHRILPLETMKRYLSDTQLDPRWRDLTLLPLIRRLEDALKRAAAAPIAANQSLG